MRFENLFAILFAILFYSFFCSCSMGVDVDATPGATKLTVKNNSSLELQNVVWNEIEFGNIAPGRVTEKIISDGNGYIYFIANNNKYRTQLPIVCFKHRNGIAQFIDNTPVRNIETSEEGPLNAN